MLDKEWRKAVTAIRDPDHRSRLYRRTPARQLLTVTIPLYRFEQLCLRTIANPPRELIAETVDVVALVTVRNGRRSVEQIVEVLGLDERGGYRLAPIFLPLRSSAAKEIS